MSLPTESEDIGSNKKFKMALNKPLNNHIHDFLEDARDALFGNERQMDLREIAQQSGFRFKKRLSFEKLDLKARSFPLFRKAKRKRISNVLSRREEELKADIQVMDTYKEGDFGKHTTTVILVKSPLLELPEFHIRPKRTTEKITGLFFTNAPGLARYPEFSKIYHVESPDTDWLDFNITEKLVDLLMLSKQIQVHGKGIHLCIYEGGKEQKPEKILSFVDLALDIVRVILYDKSNELV